MLAAMEQVRNELGPEALIVSIRKVLTGPAWQVWQKPQVEVVAVAQQTEPGKSGQTMKTTQKREPRQEIPAKAAVRPVAKEINKEPIQEGQSLNKPESIHPDKKIYLDSLFTSGQDKSPSVADSQKQIEQDKNEFLGKLILQLAKQQDISPKETQAVPPKIEQVTPQVVFDKQDDKKLQMILDHVQSYQLEPELMDQLKTTCKEILLGKMMVDEQRILDCIQTQLVSKIRTVGNMDFRGVPLFLVGGSGAGKTTTCAKLAIHFSAMRNKKVFWVCADTVRFGAVQEAKNYCDTIGIPMQPVYSADELRQVVDSVRDEFDITLIDMPAYNALDENNLVELGSWLTSIPARLIWLVVPAVAAYQPMLVQANAIKPFRPNGMIYTKLDEITQFSPMINLAWRSQLPLVFFAFGSQLINEMIPAKAELLVKALFSERFRV